jgi:hypothetical protein
MVKIGTIRLCRRFILLLVSYGVAISMVFVAVLPMERTSDFEFVLLGSSVAGLAMIIIAAFAVCLSLRCPNCHLPYFAKGPFVQRFVLWEFLFEGQTVL